VFAAVSFVAVSAAFFISNGAFYLFSGRYPDLSFTQYAARVAEYYVPYLSGAVIYLLPVALLYALFTRPGDAAKAHHAG